MLKNGDEIPDIKLLNQDEEWVNLTELTGKGPLIIYFYPKDETPGCTAEACGFRDSYEEFKELGAEVYGISTDSPESHRKFIKRHRLNFNLLSDSNKKAEKAFGVPRNLFGLIPGRVTFIVDDNGKIAHSFNSQTQAKKHIEIALKKLKELTS